MERLTEKIGNTNCVKGCGSNCKYGFQHCRTEDWENCKTIDDFVESVKNLIADSSVIRFKDIDEIAEHLKVGDIK